MNRVLSRYSFLREEVKPTNPGNRIKDEYKLTYNDDGSKELVVCGKVDVYEMIQSHADSVDVHAIIERCTMTGDMSELYKTKGFYADLSEFPSTYAEVLKSVAEAEYLWKKLPSEVKEKFDNDVSKFYANAFTEDWYKNLSVNDAEHEEVIEKKEGEVVE